MVKTASLMLPLGTPAPLFSLFDVVSKKFIRLDESNEFKGTVIMFICNHCPYVKHINRKMVEIAHRYLHQGIRFFAINSNDATQYPDDSPENMKRIATELEYPFPYLYDETQEVAHAYQAACTPDFFLFDKNLNLVYRGQFDDARPHNTIPVTGQSLCEALDLLLENKPLPSLQKPSLGCNIKWKSSD